MRRIAEEQERQQRIANSRAFDACLRKGLERFRRLHEGQPGESSDRLATNTFRQNYTAKDEPPNLLGPHYLVECTAPVGPAYSIVVAPNFMAAITTSHGGKRPPLPLSEILFQQYSATVLTDIRLGEAQRKLVCLMRYNVASETGIPVLAYIRNNYQPSPQGPFIFTDEDPAFFACLGTQNGSATVPLILDHRLELGIVGIKAVVIHPTKANMTFVFTTS